MIRKICLTLLMVLTIKILSIPLIHAQIWSDRYNNNYFPVNVTFESNIRVKGELSAEGYIYADGVKLGSGGVSAGDMSKEVYDINDNDIVDKSETIDDGAGNVKNALQVFTHINSVSNPHSIIPNQINALTNEPGIIKNIHLSTEVINSFLQDITYTEEFHVNSVSGNDLNSGTLYEPVATIMGAINKCSNGSASIVYIHKAGAEDLTFNGKENICICGLTTPYDAQTTKLVGNHIITGTSTRIKFAHMYLWSDTGTVLTCNGSEGRHYFFNVTFANGDSSPVIEYKGDSKLWNVFHSCLIDGELLLGGAPSVGCGVQLVGLQSLDTDITISHAYYNMRVYDLIGLGLVTHNAGTFVARNVHEWEADGSGNCIISTATQSIVDRLYLINCNFYRFNYDTYGKINKTGDCDYIISGCNRNSSIDVITGSRISYGEIDVDIKNTSSVTGNSVKDALDYLDDATFSFLFTQATPNSQWEFDHPFSQNFVVQIYKLGYQILPNYIYNVDSDTIRIDFGSNNVSGEAILIGIK